ncbi:MAG: hypothetical protein WC666_00975 [Candidatus Paceibacterota bacterium]|jgi:hypothetical protein
MMMLGQSQEFIQEQRLTISQKQIIVASQELSLKTQLIQALTGDQYTPKGECPKCSRKLTPAEILKGFSRDPSDFTTQCSGCGYRFEPKLISFRNGTSIELPFFCAAQTLEKMRSLGEIGSEEIAQKHPAVYRAAIFHHGTLKNAFQTIGIDYKLEKPIDWKDKLRPFLGRLPDALIAMHAGISPRRVSNMRREAKISRYSVRDAMREIENYEE